MRPCACNADTEGLGQGMKAPGLDLFGVRIVISLPCAGFNLLDGSPRPTAPAKLRLTVQPTVQPLNRARSLHGRLHGWLHGPCTVRCTVLIQHYEMLSLTVQRPCSDRARISPSTVQALLPLKGRRLHEGQGGKIEHLPDGKQENS